MKKYLIMLFTVLSTFFNLNAQDIREDILSIGREFGKHNSFHMTIEVTVYENALNKTIKKRMEGNVYKDDKHYAYDIDDYCFLLNDDAMLMIDHSNQTILYEEVGGQDNLEALYNSYDIKNTINQLDTMLEHAESIKFLGVIDGYKQYVLKNDKSLIQATHLYIDATKNTLNKIVYYYNTELYSSGSLVEINYPIIDFDFNEFEKYLSVNNFVSTTQDGIVGVYHCTGYEVITEPLNQTK